MVRQLDYLFHPRSIAVVGASDRPVTVGYSLARNLMNGAFAGPIYPVNPAHAEIGGQRSYERVTDLPEAVDLVVIATPARTVPEIVEDSGQHGAKGVVIISAGFTEAGAAGQALNECILRSAEKYGMRVLGPNCLGFINPRLGLNPSFSSGVPQPGNVAFISQSGALCTAILDWSVENNVGFSQFISVGSMLDIGFHDLIDYLGNDPHTRSILIYLESIKDPRRFLSAARAFSRNKPIIVLKAGKSPEGALASLSHTGSLAGDEAIFQAAFNRVGIIQVNTIQQLFNCAQALAMQPRPLGDRLAIVTNAGGPGVLATDYVTKNGGRLAQLGEETLAALDEFLPAYWSHNNPVDVLGDAGAASFSRAVQLCEQDPQVDAVLAIVTSQGISDPADVARALVANKKSRKTILACWMGEGDVQEARDLLDAGQIPNYRYPESAVLVFLQMFRYSRNLELLYEMPPDIPATIDFDRTGARAIINEVRADSRSEFTETEAKNLLRCYHLDVVEGRVVKSPEDAADYARSIGFPVVVKMSVPGLHHKSEVRGVRLGVSSRKGVRKLYRRLLEIAKEQFPDIPSVGVRIEKMSAKRYELHLGAHRDPIFGPVISFGTGGMLVDVFKDLNMGLPPLNMALAERVIENTKIYRALQGYRGQAAVDLEALKFTLVKFAYLIMDFPEIKEIDINPYAVDELGALVLDAHVALLDEPLSQPLRPYHHLVISPYPTHYERQVTLSDGRPIALRPIRPEDEKMEAAMLASISEESNRFRFMGYVPKFDHNSLAHFTHNDYDREIAIIAILQEAEGPVMSGVVRVISDPWNEVAEYAILVADDYQGLGLGKILTSFIIEIATDRGIAKLEAEVMNNNRAMLHLLRKNGFRTVDRDIDASQLILELPTN